MRYPSSASIGDSVARSVVKESIEHVARCDEPVRGLLGERLGEKITLRVFTSERRQLPQLTHGLHALGHDFDAEVVRERHDRLYELTVFVARIKRRHERAIDLQRVDRKRDEIRKRRVAGAEVVDAE